MNRRDLVRQGLILAVLCLDGLLAHYSTSTVETVPRVYRAVSVGSYTVIAMAVAIWLRALLLGKEHVQNLPPLSVRSVIIYVYGLGLLVFVSVYCLLDLSGCGAFYYASMVGIGAHDIIERWREPLQRRLLLSLCTLFALLTFSISYGYKGDSQEMWGALQSSRWTEVAYGVVLPALTPFVYMGIRGRRFYTPLTVMEFIHLSLPCAVHFAVASLMVTSVADTRASDVKGADRNFTATGSIGAQLAWQARLITQQDITTPFLCFMMAPTVFFAIQTSLLYSIVDFMAPAAAVAALRHAACGAEPSSASVALMACGWAALLLRIYTCFDDRSDESGSLYTSEVELDDVIQEQQQQEPLLTDRSLKEEA